MADEGKNIPNQTFIDSTFLMPIDSKRTKTTAEDALLKNFVNIFQRTPYSQSLKI